MKILFVVEHFYPYVGGAEELFLNLTVSLVKEGHDVQVVTTHHDRSLQKSEDHEGVKITRVRCYNRFLFTLLSLPTVLRKAKTADFIHTTSYNSAVPSFIAGLFLRKKVVITFHEVWGKLWFKLPFTPKWKLALFYMYEWFILKLPFSKYVAVSDYTRKSLITNGIAENKIIKIYNGLDYEKLKPYQHQPPGKFTFCFFGRLGISKGIDLLLKATKQFVSNYPDATLKLIIPTYPRNLFVKVMRSIKKYQLEKNIVILHNLSRDRLLKEVSTSSCVVIPSYSEGFCYVAVESAGMSVPIIASREGSLPEVIGGQHIFLESLSADAIFDALGKAEKSDWKNKIQPAFHLKDSIDQYLNLYKGLE